MGRTRFGEVEHHVLLSLMRLGRRAYTVPIVREMEDRTGRGVSQAAVYIALRRLEQKGLVRSALEAPPSPEEGRSRRVFVIEDEAVALLQETREALEALWEGVPDLRGAR